MLRILFTKKDSSSFSSLIRYITKEPYSHCAVQIGHIVFHSNWKGVNADYYTSFIKENTIAESYLCINAEAYKAYKEKIMRLFIEHDTSLYDYGALLFLAIKFILKLDIKSNLWQNNRDFICTEWVSKVLFKRQSSMLSPKALSDKINNELCPNTFRKEPK